MIKKNVYIVLKRKDTVKQKAESTYNEKRAKDWSSGTIWKKENR